MDPPERSRRLRRWIVRIGILLLLGAWAVIRLAVVYRLGPIMVACTAVATLLLGALVVHLVRETSRRTASEAALAAQQRKLEEAYRQLAADNQLRASAERRLRDSESRLRDYANAASDWFWEMDLEGRFTFFSERFGEVVGIPVAYLIGKREDELSQEPEDATLRERHLADVAARRPWRDVPYRVDRPDGGTRHIRISGVPVFGLDGAFQGYRGVGRDVTAEVIARDEARQQEALLQESLDALDEAFALFDSEERLVLCNRRYRELYTWNAHLLTRGGRFEDMLRNSAKGAAHSSAIANPEEWIDRALKRFRSPAGAYEERLQDGRWLRNANYRTKWGGTITLRLDVSDLKRAEQHLYESIEALAEGVALFDAEERLLLCNSQFREIYGMDDESSSPGITFEEILRCNVGRSVHPSAMNDPEGWIAERLRSFRNQEGPLEQWLSDGRCLRVTDARTPSGGIICLRADITGIKRTEQRLRDAIKSMPGGFALYDPNDRLVLCNDQFSQLYGYEQNPEALRGYTFRDLTRAILDKTLLNLDGQTTDDWLARRQAAHAEASDRPFLLQFADGKWIEVYEHRTADGGSVSVSVDITLRRNFELALQNREATLRSLLAGSPDALLVLDEEHGVLLASAKAEELFGYTQFELIGMPIRNLLPDGLSFVNSAEDDADMVRGPAPFAALRKTREEFPVEIAVSPCKTAAGALALVAIRDVTARTEMDEALREAHKLEALGTLAGGIAHDLNNTLVPILGLTELVRESVGQSSIEYELLDDVLASAVRAKELVQQILHFSRSETTEQGQLDLRAALTDAMRLVRAALPPLVEIRADWPAEPVSVIGNETQLHQILLNLCTNSAHAMQGRAGRIDISLSCVQLSRRQARSLLLPPGRYALLNVADNGQGMPEEIRRRIFDPFFTTKSVGEGTGLGLSIVHGIVAAAGGGISVRSREGAGTRVDIYLPIVSAPEDEHSLVLEEVGV